MQRAMGKIDLECRNDRARFMGMEIILLLSLLVSLSLVAFFLRRCQVLRGKLEASVRNHEVCQTKLDFFQKGSGEMQVQFENLANRIFEDKTRVFSEKSEKELGNTLAPLREKIREFEKSVEEKYTTEAKERHTLKAEIERLTGVNDRMMTEAAALTNALKGDSKTQGDWGEMVLEKILESSGLRRGEEYELQKSYKDEEGRLYRPDVLIHLPEGKQIVVDSKVSLTAYERYMRMGEEDDLREHLQSIKNHIKDLGNKDYSRLIGVRSPEFVFMFVPIEPAYMTAVKAEGDLSAWAWKRGVAMVTATTLLTGLKTVSSLWRLEKQNRNAKQIAEEGGRLYDKFVLFLEDFGKVGKTFQDGQKHYENAMDRLQNGRGSVFKKMELLKELGASTGKQIDQKHLE